MATQAHVGDMGIQFLMNIKDTNGPVDLSEATVQFVFLSPKKRRFVVDAILLTDGTDGKVFYICGDGDLDVPGRWQLQALLELPAGSRRSSKIVFRVKPSL